MNLQRLVCAGVLAGLLFATSPGVVPQPALAQETPPELTHRLEMHREYDYSSVRPVWLKNTETKQDFTGSEVQFLNRFLSIQESAPAVHSTAVLNAASLQQLLGSDSWRELSLPELAMAQRGCRWLRDRGGELTAASLRRAHENHYGLSDRLWKTHYEDAVEHFRFEEELIRLRQGPNDAGRLYLRPLTEAAEKQYYSDNPGLYERMKSAPDTDDPYKLTLVYTAFFNGSGDLLAEKANAVNPFNHTCTCCKDPEESETVETPADG